ncbi:hypothetical protein OKJ48_27145 [Streptomyces kunmingensis]|uniref:Uncharacterized protein n=1 Tax=Streptomyces kunmingensis TaxID=68225 RepID=A0ABU6CIT9_9ACTN|nr:hypothetical protein [Streptomyces kunmingensis]MEB3963886.1 hypothetical protein [Streptomyces kunmingensis]
MPGKHFSLRVTEEEIGELTIDALDDLVRRLTPRTLDPRPSDDGHVSAQSQALTRLYMMLQLRSALDRLEYEAAQEAVAAGAGYPQLGRVLNITRQGARNRWPGLITHPSPTSADPNLPRSP